MQVEARAVHSQKQLRRWYALARQVYRDQPAYRDGTSEIASWLIGRRFGQPGKSLFLRHAQVDAFLLWAGGQALGRFALIHDRRRPEDLQVSFFEAMPRLDGVVDAILLKARAMYPQCRRAVFGLDGHLNYACGFLLNRFDQPPLFGLPYTPPYYLDYFSALEREELVSYRFQNQGFYDLRRVVEPGLDLGEITVRLLDKNHFERDMDLYTQLNNACFGQHPHWADRSSDEDLELFSGFKHFLDASNLIFAEKNGQPVGFLLWYPDYNELLGPGEALGIKSLLRYRLRAPSHGLLAHKLKSVRLTEIAVHPKHRSQKVLAAMTMRMIAEVEARAYSFTEGGFIFVDNKNSLGFTLNYIERAMGREPRPHRRYAVFLADL